MRSLAPALALVALLSLSTTSGARQAPASENASTGALLLNERAPEPGLLTGGSPKTPDEFERLAAAGYRTYVDLRTDSEVTPEMAAAAAAAGLTYARVPVGGEKELDLASARALHALLHEGEPAPTVVVCGSGNRSAALLAMESFWLHGKPAADALLLGQNAGLTRLEPSVRLLLGLPAPAPPATPPTAPPSKETRQ